MTRRSTRSQERSWSLLEARLAEALAALGEGACQFLILEDQKTKRFVQFAVEASSAVLAEAVSSDYLPEGQALGERTDAALTALGWSPPAEAGRKGKPRPANFSRTFERPIDFQAAASLAVRTLRDVFQTPHPGRLWYQAFQEKEGGAILLPALGLSGAPPRSAPPRKPRTLEALRKEVLAALREASGQPTLQLDKDGDIPVPYGSAKVHVRLCGTPPFARLEAAVVRDARVDDRLFRRLAELNRRARFGRFFLEEGWIFAATEVFTEPFVVRHVVHACRVLGELADDLRETLQAELGEGAAPAEEAGQQLKN